MMNEVPYICKLNSLVKKKATRNEGQPDRW